MTSSDISVSRRLLVMGAGGHSKVVLDVARNAGWHPAAILDPVGEGHYCNDVAVLGDDEMAKDLLYNGVQNAVVGIGLNSLRAQVGERLVSLGFECPSLVHQSAQISPYASIGRGVVIMPGAIVNAGSRIDDFTVINSGAIVEHDCIVGYGAHIAPRAVLGGGVEIGKYVLFGIGAVARPQSSVGRNSVIGAGSLVIGAVAEYCTAFGAPARKVR